MKNVAAISIDLDDTLWPIAPVIERAEQALGEWFLENCPRSVPDGGAEAGGIRKEVLQRHPDRRHDFAFLRRAGIALLLERGGYDVALVETAYRAFLSVRNEVELYDDVLPALDQLAGRYTLLAVTNGNADLVQIGLSEYFSCTIRASDVGVAKPDEEIFAAAAAAAGLPPERVVHVGDAPREDVYGARQAGMHPVWMNRLKRDWPGGSAEPVQISVLDELAALLQAD